METFQNRTLQNLKYHFRWENAIQNSWIFGSFEIWVKEGPEKKDRRYGKNHETSSILYSSNRGRFEHFTSLLSKPDLDRLLNKALQAPSVGGGCVIPITVPYRAPNQLFSIKDKRWRWEQYFIVMVHVYVQGPVPLRRLLFSATYQILKLIWILELVLL